MKYSLELVVFTSGMSVMVLELVGSRILAPFIGASIVTWTTLIGIVLASLSLGYYIGGLIADKIPKKGVLSLIIFISSLSILLVVALKLPLFSLVDYLGLGLLQKAVIATLSLFAIPSILLGMVSPFAAKLRLDTVKHTGGVVGNLYAISTVGSIVGTFLTGFYLLTVFTITQIVLGISILLLICSLILHVDNIYSLAKKIILFVLIFMATFFVDNTLQNPDIVWVDTQYNNVLIFETDYRGEKIKVMSLDGKYNSGIFSESDALVFDYSKYYHLASVFTHKVQNVLMIGGAGYVSSRDFVNSYPDVYVDTVEIDPKLTELAKIYFRLKDDPRHTIYHEDGRTFLNRISSGNSKKYDTILIDAFKGYSLPFQLTTKESMTSVYNLLSDDGVLLANVISSIEGESGKFLRAEYHTLRSIFPYVYVFPVADPHNGSKVQNLMVMALKSKMAPLLSSDNPVLNSYLAHVWTKDIAQDLPLITDDFAPVDQYMLKTLY